MNYVPDRQALANIFLEEGINTFTIDKALARPIEELCLGFVERFYAAQGKRIHVRFNLATDTPEKAKFDAIDTFGVRWEFKSDRKWWRTGNVYIETQALAHSESDFYLILAGRGYVIPTQVLRDAIKDMPKRAGGDRMSVTGALLKESQLEQLAISIL